MTSRLATACAMLILFSESGRAQSAIFKTVKVAFVKSATDRQLVKQDAELILDDQMRQIIVKNREHPLEIGYDDVQTVVFDTTAHMRGGRLGRSIGGLGGALVSGRPVTDAWCSLQYRDPAGVQTFLLTMSTEDSAAVLHKMQALFADRVTVADFPEHSEQIDRDTLKDVKSKHELKIDKTNHPTPESKPDQALVVVVCPKITAEDSGQIKLHANDRVILVNKMGTYGFVHLDPGEYVLVSEAHNGSAIRIILEKGKDYYFLQDMFMSGHTLSRHTRELVMHHVDAAFYADWRRK